MVNPVAEDYWMAAKLAGRFTDRSITLFDSIVAAVDTRLQIEIWTYDHHFDVLHLPVWR